jgi:hypothetical protein
VATTGELLNAVTMKELLVLTTAWTKRYSEGPWTIKLGYAPDRVQRTKDGFEIYMEAKR